MNLNYNILLFTLGVLWIGFLACAEKDIIETPDEMLGWIGNPEHGLVRERSGAGIRWTAKYVPHDYLAARYLESLDSYSEATRDSVMASYANTLCFLLTVTPESEEESDVMYRGVGSFEEFRSRAMSLNFKVKDLMTLNYGGKQTPAVISTMENTYGLHQRRDVMVIFARDEEAWERADTIDCVFDDRIFNSGIHHFTYTVDDIRRIPTLSIETLKRLHH